jgi:PAS domain S-box-containing protein
MKTTSLRTKPKVIGDLLDIIHNAIIVINSENKIIYANSRTAEMFNTSVINLQDNDIYHLFMPDDMEIMVNNILHITRTEHEYEGEAMLRRMDGTHFMGLIAGTSFQWDANQEGIAFSIHDITDIKAIERSLKHSERIAFLGHLVDDISHQIRNPIMVIGGFAKRLITKNSPSKEANAIMNEARHLEALLDTLNTFIHLPNPVAKRVPIGTLIEIAESTLRDTVHGYDCDWISEYEKNMAEEELLLDTDLMTKALEATIINACEAYGSNDTDRQVLFQIQHSRSSALPYIIRITDRGIGIPSTVFPHIFDHFYTNKTKHIGMGLTFAQKIVEEQRGTLTIDSTMDRGSTVNFHLVKERRRPIRTTRFH